MVEDMAKEHLLMKMETVIQVGGNMDKNVVKVLILMLLQE